MAYRMYLDGLLVPITPAKVTTQINNQNETLTLITGEEINQLKAPGLSDVSFDLLLPQVSYPFAVGVTLPPAAYLDRLERLKTSKAPFQWILSRCLPRSILPLFYSNMTVSLEDYQIVDDAEEGFDLKVKVQLKQYRPYGTRRLTITTAADGTTAASVSAAPAPQPAPPGRTPTPPRAGTACGTSPKSCWGTAPGTPNSTASTGS